MEPLIYIIILNYNGYKDTIKCLQSLKAINYKNYKIVVVDNASTDNSVEELEKEKGEFILLKSKDNTGFAGGNNFGADYAIKNGAEYVLILNNDTTVDKNFLISLINVFKEDDKLAVSVPKVYYEGTRIINTFGARRTKLGGIANIGEGEKDNNSYNSNLYVKYVMGCCMLIKSDIIKKHGLFDEKFFMYLEESDFCSRINKEYSIMAVADSIIWHKNEGSTKKANWKINYFSKYYFRRNRLLYIDKNEKKLMAIFFKLILYINDVLYVPLKHKDKKYNRVLKEAWQDYHNSHFYRSDKILDIIKGED